MSEDLRLSLPALIALMLDWMKAEAGEDDETAAEIVEALSIAWIGAARWRLEHTGVIDAGDENESEAGDDRGGPDAT